MEPKNIFIAVALVSLFNGLFSPFIAVVLAFLPFWMPEFVPATPQTALMGSSIITSFTTLFVSGIPAALYERFVGAPGPTQTGMVIWLGTASVLSLPALAVLPHFF